MQWINILAKPLRHIVAFIIFLPFLLLLPFFSLPQLKKIVLLYRTQLTITLKHFVIIAGFVFIVLLVHREVYSFIVQKSEYTVEVASLKTKIKPDWSNSNEEILIKNKGTVFDNKLSEEVYKELVSCPWVKRVISVEKVYPNMLKVKLERRIPCIAVNIDKSFVLVDSDYIRLPGQYKSIPTTLEKNVYIVVGVQKLIPKAGEKWVSEDIKAAVEVANIANRYNNIFNQFGISKIDVSNINGRIDRRKSEIMLSTRDGIQIHWGRASFTKNFGEISIEDKIKNLELILKTYPNLLGLKYAKIYIKDFPSVYKDERKLGISKK